MSSQQPNASQPVRALFASPIQPLTKTFKVKIFRGIDYSRLSLANGKGYCWWILWPIETLKRLKKTIKMRRNPTRCVSLIHDNTDLVSPGSLRTCLLFHLGGILWLHQVVIFLIDRRNLERGWKMASGGRKNGIKKLVHMFRNCIDLNVSGYVERLWYAFWRIPCKCHLNIYAFFYFWHEVL